MALYEEESIVYQSWQAKKNLREKKHSGAVKRITAD